MKYLNRSVLEAYSLQPDKIVVTLAWCYIKSGNFGLELVDF